MAEMIFTRIPDLCKYSFDEAVRACLNTALTPNRLGGTYRIEGSDLWSEFYQAAQRIGREDQLEGRYFVLRFDEDDIQQLGAEIWTHLYNLAQDLMIFARDYPGIYAVHENPASPEIHILLSNIVASPDGYHLTEGYQYAYDEVIMQCAAAFILSDLCGTSIPDDCVNPIKTFSDEER